MNSSRLNGPQRGVLAVCGACCCLIAGCDEQPAHYQAALRVAVRGEVTLNGVPLSQGRIQFECREGAELVLATASVIEGRFDLPATIGPLAGRNLVRIESEEIEDVEAVALAQSGKRLKIERFDIPARYNRETELSSHFRIGIENVVQYQLTTKPKDKGSSLQAGGELPI